MHDDIAVKDWPGLDAEAVETIAKTYILPTLRSFLTATEDEDVRETLRAAGMSDARIDELREDARRHLEALPEVVIHGILADFFETGTEGVCWAVYEDGKQSYDGLHLLGPRNHLRVTDETGAVRFDGYIDPDAEKGWMEYPGRPGEGYGQPAALGYWIHWIQAGWEPDEWAALFFRPHLTDPKEKGPPLRAVLTYNKKRD